MSREIDKLVAIHVRGWSLNKESSPVRWNVPLNDSYYRDYDLANASGDYVPPFSTEISVAWELVEKMILVPDDKWFFEIKWSFNLVVFRPAQAKDIHAKQFECINKSLPFAICLAALKAVGVEVPELSGGKNES